MFKLLPIFIFSIIMAYISDGYSSYEYDAGGVKQYIRKNKFFYVTMGIVMAVFVGLRTSGNDTGTYRVMYEAIPNDATAFSAIDWKNLSAAPGHQFVCACLKNLGASTQDYFMLFAVFSIAVYLWFIRKYTNSLALSIYFYITMGVFTFAMAAIKQTAAVAILLIATDRAVKKKYHAFIFYVLLAELFHPYAFVYLVIPLMFFTPWTKKTYWLLGGAVVVSLLLSRLMGGILAMTDALGGNYSSTDFSGEGVNIFRVLAVWVPVFLSFWMRERIKRNSTRTGNMIINLSMLNAMIMFIGLFGTANYFARLANYFWVFQVLALPLIFYYFSSSNKKVLKVTSVICYFVFFYYDQVIVYGAFDDRVNMISIFEYIRQLLG